MLNIKSHVRAGYSALAIETYEDARFSSTIMADYPEWNVFSVSATGSVMNLRDRKDKAVENLDGYEAAFEFIAAKGGAKGEPRSFLIVLDFQYSVSNPMWYRALLNAMPEAKKRGNMILLLAPSWSLPPELQREVRIRRADLPGEEELGRSLDVIAESARESTNQVKGAAIISSITEKRRAFLSAGRGLTMNEFENAAALAAVDASSGGMEPSVIEDEKLRLVQSSYMSVENPRPASDLGGVRLYKRFITEELLPSLNDKQLQIHAIGAFGIPGTGKTLGARVLSSQLGMRMIRASAIEAKGGIVGQSETALKNIFVTARSLAPVILFFDEIEKWASGAESSGKTDGGSTSGQLAIMLTQMQDIYDNADPVLMYFTANDDTKIPPELLRRMDERFFFDVPNWMEREEIAGIHMHHLDIGDYRLAEQTADCTKNFTPWEIERVIKSAARKTARQLTPAAITEAAALIIPVFQSAEIQRLRDGARSRMRWANEEEQELIGGRRLE